jgi:autotransporter-associated beta strand protein
MSRYYYLNTAWFQAILLWTALTCHATAATLTWDANGAAAPNPQDGSGAWLSTSNWWNGATNLSGTWTGTTPDSALFGAGAAGVYSISLGAINTSNLIFGGSSYTLTGGSLSLSPTSGTNLVVSNNVIATINSPLTQGNGVTWSVGSGASLSLAGGGFNASGNFIWKGGGTVNLLAGTYTPGVLWLQNVNVNQGSSALNPSADVLLGYAGNCTYTLSNALASMTVYNRLLVGRAGSTGVLNLQNGKISASGSGGGPAVSFGYDGGSVGVLNQSGGTLTVTPGQYLYVNYGANSSGGSGTVNLSGGLLRASAIQFGNAATAYNANTFATLNISGGTLYLGSGGMVANTNAGGPPGKISILFSGGMVGATADWTSSLPITLTNVNGNITFQAADAAGRGRNITMAGTLSGSGGFSKTGGGILTLSGAGSYSGATVINNGTVLLSGNGTATGSSGFSLTNGSTLCLLNTASANNANRLADSGALTFNGGVFSFLNDSSPASFSETAGPLVVNSGANMLNVFPAPNGHTSALTFASLTLNGGSVDFQMASAGTSQNKVFFVTPPILGSWLTVNGEPAAYDSVNGLRGAATYTDIAALGSMISNAPSSNVRINTTGSGGNIQLDSSTAVINSLQQNTTTPAIVDTASKVLRLNRITVNTGAQPLTIGAFPGSGVLTAASSGGALVLENKGGFAPGLAIDSVVMNNVLPSSLTVLGGGLVTLAAPNNSFSGGVTISNGSLVVTAGSTVAMPYTIISGTLSVKLAADGTPLPATSFTIGGTQPQLSFDVGNVPNPAGSLIEVAGGLEVDSDVAVSVTNVARGTGVLLRYTGKRTGPGRFVPGTLPAGTSILDDPNSQTVSFIYISGPTLLVPPHRTNDLVVALATPQQYGAAGDGVTDDTLAFQTALNAVGNSGGVGGGVVYVPAGAYAFSNSLTIPLGVTMQGDWADWSQDTNGVTGTLFKVYGGAGQTNGAPFLTINHGALRGVSIWYPNQDPANITPYPYTISLNSDTVVENVALINSYQGILGYSAAKHVFSTVIGSPLYVGISVDAQYDISQQQDVRFSPDFWPASRLPGAPAPGGPHAAWMRSNGIAELLYRADGEACMDLQISGYKVGFSAVHSTNGDPAASFYGGYISNCATAYLDGTGGGNTGVEFTQFTLDGDTAVDRATNVDASAYFHTCCLVGHNGIAVRQTGGNSSTMQFQHCDVSGTVRVDGGIANFVNSSLNVAPNSNHCIMASGAIYAAFTGCNFNPTRKISNSADARRLVIDGRRASTSPLPRVSWSDIQADLQNRRPARSDLFVATAAPWNAAGDGVADDTAAIQAALDAAGTNGGGIVYLPAGKYKLASTLDVPSGVELRGSFPSRHAATLYDGHVKITVLQPYAGAGDTSGPPAVALESNAGIVGLTITYELQDTNATAYPPAIQGRGTNVYALGVLAPNAYWYVDLNTYTCANHFFYQVDGWAIRNAIVIGNGSRGSIVECMANWSYWVDNNLSASQLSSTWQPPIKNFAEHNLDWFVLGDCAELMVKNFDYLCHDFMLCIDQNGRGPWIDGILTMTDAAVECFHFAAAAPCGINIVNPEWMVTLADYPDLTGYGVISEPGFQGTARFFNAPLWGGRPWDYRIQGGDVGFELAHMGYVSTYGTRVDGGVLHLINCGFEGNTASLYNVPFASTTAVVPGKLSEIIGCYAWTGVSFTRTNAANPVAAWGNFGINTLTTRTPLDVTPPRLTLSRDPAAQIVSLTWSNDMGAFSLYSTPDLGAASTWELTTQVSYFATNCWTVRDSTTNATRQYYRLQQ